MSTSHQDLWSPEGGDGNGVILWINYMMEEVIHSIVEVVKVNSSKEKMHVGCAIHVFNSATEGVSDSPIMDGLFA